MACIERIKHDTEGCTKEKGLQVFYNEETKKYSGFCFSCDAKGLPAYVADPYNGEEKPKPKLKSKEEIFEEVQEVRALGAPTFEHRGIPASYYKRYGVKLALSEEDGQSDFSLNFPYVVDGKLGGYKVRPLTFKAFWSVGNIIGADLFNWHYARKKNVKRLYVTESEIDCISLEYMLESQAKAKNSQYNKFAVVSLPFGAGSAVTTLGRMRKEIEARFDQIVLVFDADEAGQKAVEDVVKIMPDVLVAPYPTSAKDANEALQAGDKAIFADYVLWKSRKPTIEGVVSVETVLKRSVEPPKMGLSYPWTSLTELSYGQRFGEATAWGAGVGLGKCCGFDTPTLMYDGSIKMVQDVVVGDMLMGDDSTARHVRSTLVGEGEMFRVIPVKGDTYTFNRDHILAIYITNFNDRKYLLDGDGVRHEVGSRSTITIDTYLRSSDKFKHNSKLYRTGIDFQSSGEELPIPPYILGAWLGDGTTARPNITTSDRSIKEDWIEWGRSIGCGSRVVQCSGCETIFLRTPNGQPNPALNALRNLGVLKNKHIPQQYLTASREDRLELLAGILDTDGHLADSNFDLVLKQKQLSDQVCYLARSLGLSSHVKETVKSIKSLNFSGTYYRQCISGDTDTIPTKIKVAEPRKQIKDVLVTGFTVEPVGVDKYYGFDISGNRLYVLGDFTVTHNTLIAHEVAAHNIIEHNENVFMVLLEEQNHETLYNVSGKIDSLPYHKPACAEEHWDKYLETARALAGRLFMWESEGNISNRFDIDEILKAIRFNSLEYGVRFHVIDNMTRLVDHLTSGEANEYINKYSSEIANLATELNIHIDVYSHLNQPRGKGEVDHESGGEVKASQFTGSRGIMRSFPVLGGFERNKHADGDLRNNSYISIIKNRKYGGENKIKTQYNPKTGRLLEYDWDGDSLY